MLRMNRRKCQATTAGREGVVALVPARASTSWLNCRTSRALISAVLTQNERKYPVRGSTFVPSNLALRYPCCYACRNTRLPPVGSGPRCRLAKVGRKHWAVFRCRFCTGLVCAVLDTVLIWDRVSPFVIPLSEALNVT